MQFMFECVMGLRGFQGSGCILADDMVRACTASCRRSPRAHSPWRLWFAGAGQDASGNHAAVDAAAPRHGWAAGCKARHHRLPDLAGLQLVRCARRACGSGGKALTLNNLQGFRVREMAQGPCAYHAAGGVGTCRRHRKRDAVPVAAQPDPGAPHGPGACSALWLTRLIQVLIVSYETFRLHSVRMVRSAGSGAILTLHCRSGSPHRQPATCSSATRRTG